MNKDTKITSQQKRQGQKQKLSQRYQIVDLDDSINRTTSSTDGGFWTKMVRLEKKNLSLLKNESEINLTVCLTQSQRTKVCRGFSITTGIEIIVKIVLIYKRLLKIYRMILGQAQQYYRRHKKGVKDLIMEQDKILAFCNSANAPAYKEPSQQQIYLQIVRPYFSGRSFHQQIYVHSKFSYGVDELATYIKHVIDMLITDSHQPVFLPTLDNIYFDGVQIVGNLTSFETYMFLRKENQHLATQNFKQLYILLPSDPKVFCQWQQMRDYMFQTMKLKAFLVMIFCFATIRSPVEMVFGQKINQQELQWPRLVNPKTFEINQLNKIICMIRDLPNRWRRLLEKPENRKCLQILSQYIFKGLKDKKYTQNETTQDSEHTTYSQQQKNYLYNLLQRVFVREKPIGWNDFFHMKYQSQTLIQKDSSIQQYLTSLEPLRMFVINSAKDEQLVKKQHETIQKMYEIQKRMIDIPEEDYDTAPESESQGLTKRPDDWVLQIQQTQRNLPMSRLDEREWKRLVAKAGFFYLHKYFIVGDIKKRKLNRQKAASFTKRLHFQTYLPLKLSLSLSLTLEYQDWFQIFFEEMKEQRPVVYDAAKKLYNLIKEKSVEIMKSVKGCELSHLKRVQYILVKKLNLIKMETNELAQLNQEKQQFATEVKLYDHMLESALNAIKNAQIVQDVKITKFQQLKMYEGEQYDDIRVILKTYLKIQEMYTKSKNSLEWSEDQKKQIKKYLKKVDDLKGPLKLRMSFRNILEQRQDVKTLT